MRLFKVCFYPRPARGKLACRRVRAMNMGDAARVVLRTRPMLYVQVSGRAIFYRDDRGRTVRSKVTSL